MSAATPSHLIVPVTGLTCAACVTRLEKALNKREGVTRAQVNLALATLDIELADRKAAQQLPQWIDATGFGLEREQRQFEVGNITCAACVGRIEKALGRLPGVESVSVNLATSQVKVSWYSGLTRFNDIKNLLNNINYPVIESLPDDAPKQDASAQLLRHALTGLALSLPMVAVMLADFVIDVPMLPAWLQWLLTTPIQFWLGARFYRGAYHSVKSGSANMDVLVAIGTSAAYFYSLYLWLALGSGHLYFEAAAVVISLVLLGKWMEERAKKTTGNAIRALMKLQPPSAQKWHDNELVKTDVDDLQVGDELQILPGDTVPADGIVLRGQSAVDEAMLTGESLPIEKGPDDVVLAGSRNSHGSLRVRVHRSPEQFRLKQIVQLVNDAQMQKPDIQKLVDKVAAVFVPVVLIIAALTMLLQWWLNGWDAAFDAAVSVLVIACPCALGLATPTAIMAGSGVGARRGVLIRDINQLQLLTRARALVFDKTGTLTEGTPTVVQVHRFTDQTDLLAQIKQIQQQSQHPLAEAMVRAIEEPAQDLDFAFHNISGQGVVASSANTRLLIGNERLLNEHGLSVEKHLDAIQNPAASLVWVALNESVAACFEIVDPLRADSRTSVQKLQQQGFEIWMLSGDHQRAAEAAAHELGMDNCIANLLPEHKAQAVAQLQKKAGSVIMIGDGINDAPALASADASIAMGSGTDVAMDAAGITLMRPEITLVLEAIAIARKTQQKIKQNLFWAFIYNCIGIPLAAFGLLNPVVAGAAMAFSSVSVVSSSLLLLRWQPKV